MKIKSDVPVLGFAAYSGTGKTTLLVNLIPLLKQHGIEVGVIKHAHHTFEIDQAGKDSYKIRKAGASQMLIGSKERWALMVEQRRNRSDNTFTRIYCAFGSGINWTSFWLRDSNPSQSLRLNYTVQAWATLCSVEQMRVSLRLRQILRLLES